MQATAEAVSAGVRHARTLRGGLEHERPRVRVGPDRGSLDDLDVLRRLTNRLLRLVCSEPWADHCKGLVVSGAVPLKDKIEVPLRQKGVYPPGGLMTAMKPCRECRRWMPPQYVGSDGTCLECYYAGLSLFRLALTPSSKCFDHRMKDREAPAHFEGSGFDKRSERRRWLGKDGLVHGYMPDDTGELVEVVFVPAETPSAEA